MARGIDIDNISLILNFDVPRQVEDYVHRIGRTGRYDKTGIAITFVNKKDRRAFSAIQDKVGDQLEILEADKKKKPSKDKERVRKTSNAQNDPKKKKDSVKEKKTSQKPEKKEDKTAHEKKESKPKKMTKKEIKQANKKVNDLKNISVIYTESKETKKYSKTKKGQKNSNRTEESSKDENVSSIPAERIKKATKRNQKSLKPAKGIWGLIKALFS